MSSKDSIHIGKHIVGPGHPPFLIAEMSGNHNQSLDKALQIVDVAAETGVQALKIQTYTADTMTLNIDTNDFMIKDPDSLWSGKSLHKLYQEAFTPWEWHEAIFDRCREKGLIGFSTPFDKSAVDFLESLNVPVYKIASFENTDLELVKYVAATGKPLIISTGVSTPADIWETVEAVRSMGNDQIILLKCTSAYPALPEDCNLRTMPHMSELYNVHVGLSDHTLGIGVAIASVALGARVIEKHFTLDRKEKGVDSEFSMEPHEFKLLTEESLRTWKSLGEVRYQLSSKETKSLEFKRSLYITKNINKGEAFSMDNISSIRPGKGLPIKFKDIFIGKTCSKDVKKGTPLHWDLLT